MLSTSHSPEIGPKALRMDSSSIKTAMENATKFGIKMGKKDLDILKEQYMTSL